MGGLTRRTVGHESVDPNVEAISDVLHWIWSWRLQVVRLRQTTAKQGQGDSDVERRQSYSAASYDEHALAVVGCHVVRAVDRAGQRFGSIAVAEQQSEPLRLLRDLYEHWDEQRESFRAGGPPRAMSGKSFSKKFPEGQPWSIAYVAGDWLLGGVVSLNGLTRELDVIEEEALSLETQLKQGGEKEPE